MKRAQGLPINTIIVMVLAIVLLLFLGYLVQSRGGVFMKETSECDSRGGKCIVSASDCIAENGVLLGFSCPDEKPACCRRNV